MPGLRRVAIGQAVQGVTARPHNKAGPRHADYHKT
jgi:hypothetical protein